MHLVRLLKYDPTGENRLEIRLVNPTCFTAHLHHGYHQLELVLKSDTPSNFVASCKREMLLEACPDGRMARVGSKWRCYEPSMAALVGEAQDDLRYKQP